ncbi:MAG: hypothetical protein Q9213_005827 [Squamulea squamosa]
MQKRVAIVLVTGLDRSEARDEAISGIFPVALKPKLPPGKELAVWFGAFCELVLEAEFELGCAPLVDVDDVVDDTPEFGAGVAPEFGAEVAPEFEAEVAPELGPGIAPEFGTGTAAATTSLSEETENPLPGGRLKDTLAPSIPLTYTGSGPLSPFFV